MTRILFVCHGNICRSPMAEFIFKSLARAKGLEGRFYVESASTSTEEMGNPIYPPARRCLRNHGIPFDACKTARQISFEDYRRYDMIICMDTLNLRWLSRIIPDDPERKIRLLMSFAGSNRSVADPWYTGDFETTYNDLLEGCQALLKFCIHFSYVENHLALR